MLRYSVLRLLIFFGVAGILWLLGLKDEDEMIVLVLLAGLISLVISAVVLKPFRDEASDQIARKVEERRARRAGQVSPTDADAAAEDAEADDFR